MQWIQDKYINMLCTRFRNFKVRNGVYNFSCPLCGDSKKNKFKARGFILWKEGRGYGYYCHNCGASRSFDNFLAEQDPALHRDYVLEVMKNKDNPEPVRKAPTNPRPVIQEKNPFRKLQKVSQLHHDHPAKRYVVSRLLPSHTHHDIYYTEDFQGFTNNIVPKKFPQPQQDRRIVFPFRDRDKTIFGFQGRTIDGNEIKFYTIMLDYDSPKVFGLDRITDSRTVYIVESPIDSLFFDNCIAMAGSSATIKFPEAIWIFDNEPRNKHIVKKVSDKIEEGARVCIWPNTIASGLDINDLIKEGWDPVQLQMFIKNHSYSGMQAELKFTQWRKD